MKTMKPRPVLKSRISLLRSLAVKGAVISPVAGALALLLLAAPSLRADPSDTNHGSETGIANADANGTANSDVNGIGGTAPLPEASTWIGVSTLVGAAAAVTAMRRQRARP
jgi:hypothetical protein